MTREAVIQNGIDRTQAAKAVQEAIRSMNSMVHLQRVLKSEVKRLESISPETEEYREAIDHLHETTNEWDRVVGFIQEACVEFRRVGIERMDRTIYEDD